MKKSIPDIVSGVNEKYLLEASPDNFHPVKKRRRLKVVLAAACICCIMTALGLILFLPFKTAPRKYESYKNSEYYDIIKTLDEMTFKKPKYKNNFEKLLGGISNAVNTVVTDTSLTGEVAVPEADFSNNSDGAPSVGTGGAYSEVTDNQVSGVIEADRIKRSDKYIFYLYRNSIEVFSIKGESSEKVGEYTLLFGNDVTITWSQWEFYLSNDCKTLTVIMPYQKHGESQACIKIISLNVENPANITQNNSVTIKGGYVSSRMTDGVLLLISSYSIRSNIDFANEETYIPMIDTGNGMEAIRGVDITVPDEAVNTRYTVVTKLSESDLSLGGNHAFLSYTDDVYVNRDKAYLFNVFSEKTKTDTGYIRNSMTEITCLDYKDEIRVLGNVTVRGYVKDQYSLDELNGILRVVTTTNATKVREEYRTETVSASVLQTATGNSNASLYCIDISSWKVVASVIDFAPPKEEVMSVRFDGSYAYVCTAIEMSDPVYFFDLSDISNITYKDSGTIDGFSTSLVNFGDGYLLGIGVDDSRDSLKIEIYEEGSSSVNSVCSYVREMTGYSANYKSYYIDRENSLIGLGITDYHSTKNSSWYILLMFDGNKLHEIVRKELSGDPEYMRAVLIDGYLYMFGLDDFKVVRTF